MDWPVEPDPGREGESETDVAAPNPGPPRRRLLRRRKPAEADVVLTEQEPKDAEPPTEGDQAAVAADPVTVVRPSPGTSGWSALVNEHHGERRASADPEVPSPDWSPPEPAATSGAEAAEAVPPEAKTAEAETPEAETPPEETPDAEPEPETPEPEPSAPEADPDVPDASADRIDRRIDKLHDEIATASVAIRERLIGLTEEINPRVGEIEFELEASISVLFDQIGRLDDKLASSETRHAEELAALRTGFDALQSAFSETLDRLEQSEPHPAVVAPLPAGGRVALNSATFEDLRGLGLSVTQAARIVAFRDTHGGFSELDQLREVRGLAADDLRLLLDRSTL